MTHCEVHHSVFSLYSLSGLRIYLIVYVDDTIIIGNDFDGILWLKSHFHSQFQTMDLGSLRYFLVIEVAQS